VSGFSRTVNAATATPQLQVVVNWFEELKRLAPGEIIVVPAIV
jgi:hypothetical protein